MLLRRWRLAVPPGFQASAAVLSLPHVLTPKLTGTPQEHLCFQIAIKAKQGLEAHPGNFCKVAHLAHLKRAMSSCHPFTQYPSSVAATAPSACELRTAHQPLHRCHAEVAAEMGTLTVLTVAFISCGLLAGPCGHMGAASHVRGLQGSSTNDAICRSCFVGFNEVASCPLRASRFWRMICLCSTAGLWSQPRATSLSGFRYQQEALS